ncbi:conserved hypothetical protein [Vibrio chagasii]|nr:conserved hypothetical protein [Vibrio chagasii]CAH7392655.1 conserved hypothetical protein [Vibrio chagasii]CAH7420184.1 conserved hypothetical protein [Vibrio chagasii]
MIINTPELTLLFRYIRVQVVSVLGGEPKHWHSDEELDEYLTNIDERMVCLLHDLLVMLDYVYTLKLNNIDLENEERDILDAAQELILAVKYLSQRDKYLEKWR